MLHHDWDLFDTRHVVFRPARLSAEELEAGYWRAYREFYRWGAIVAGRLHQGQRCAGGCGTWRIAGGWKKFEPMWDVAIRTGQVLHLLPVLEAILSGFGEQRPRARCNTTPGRGVIPAWN